MVTIPIYIGQDRTFVTASARLSTSLSMFHARNLARVFPGQPGSVHALRGVDLDVPVGQFTAVVGPSGCGKTTLLRILAGFDRPDVGNVWQRERHVAGPGVFVRPERRNV